MTNTSAEVILPWADNIAHGYKFALKLKQLDELQRVCGGPGVGDLGAIVERVFTGRAAIRDIHETIRLGLIGGGTEDVRAAQLVATYVDGKPLAEPDNPSAPLAVAKSILGAVWFGLSELTGDDGTKKDRAAAGETE